MPSRDSKLLIVWLNADCEIPNLIAARVKLRSSVTAISAAKSSR
jgi:hypothetical protein